MRILVLGSGPGASNARRLAHERGLRLARHALDSVTYIVTDDTVSPRDPKVVAARALGVHVVPDTEFVNQPENWPPPRPVDGSAVAPMAHGAGHARTLRHSHGHAHSHGHRRSAQAQQAMDSLFRAINNADASGIREALRQFVSVVWAISPLLTAGLSAPIMFGHAAAKLKSVVAGIAAFAYAGMAIAYITLFAMEGQNLADGEYGNVNPIAMVSLFALLFGSTAHAFMIRNKVFPPRAADTERPARVVPTDEAEARVLARRERRVRARRLLKDDPAMADELGIGRPDLELGYDDGGLVDVNHAPAEVLAAMRGIDERTAERIVAVRELSGTFASTAELVVRADLDPEAMRLVDEYAVYG
ncbi:helix-hairpin-helix domain-containing protein [Phytomonospora sp. NPDC050363]|uniref:ComEA family DNA-binding protein n=1 Tax=Phytomonospora sp. NPDC050363 TaxID=3155642 RepID=UPI0033DE5012